MFLRQSSIYHLLTWTQFLVHNTPEARSLLYLRSREVLLHALLHGAGFPLFPLMLHVGGGLALKPQQVLQVQRKDGWFDEKGRIYIIFTWNPHWGENPLFLLEVWPCFGGLTFKMEVGDCGNCTGLPRPKPGFTAFSFTLVGACGWRHFSWFSVWGRLGDHLETGCINWIQLGRLKNCIFMIINL